MKKHLGHSHPLSRDQVMHEVGDVFFYAAWLAELIGFTFDEAFVANIDKLKRRYPEGFSSERSLNRINEQSEVEADLAQEMETQIWEEQVDAYYRGELPF